MAKLLKIKALFKLPIISWAMYDFANTSFAVVIMTVVFPVYFTNVIVSGSGYGLNFGDLMWGICSGATMLLAALIAPIFGAVADTSRSKNKFLIILTCFSVFFCFLLYFLGSGMIATAMILFIASNFFYQTSMMFYNSFLPELSNKDNTGTVSGFGFALGYLGGLITLLIIFPLIRGGLEAQNLTGLRLTFVITAVFFLVFSIPSFLFLKDKPTEKVIN
ncbi:MAG: MFS transporter, partial [Actinobacteria bacterium]|nr:MFS transporter [Actinomycetota bacterium]